MQINRTLFIAGLATLGTSVVAQTAVSNGSLADGQAAEKWLALRTRADNENAIELAPSSKAGASDAEAPGALASSYALYAPSDHSDGSVETRSDFYLRVTGGLVTTEDSSGPDEDIEFDEGFLLSVGLGQRIGASENGIGFALELEGIWTDQDADDQGAIQALTDVNVLGALIDGIVDFRFAERLTVYGGAGIGAAWMDVGTESDALNDFSEDDGPFLAWQLKTGVAWGFTPTLALHVGYRFLNIDDAEIDDDIGAASFELETTQHVLEAGLIFGL